MAAPGAEAPPGAVRDGGASAGLGTACSPTGLPQGLRMGAPGGAHEGPQAISSPEEAPSRFHICQKGFETQGREVLPSPCRRDTGHCYGGTRGPLCGLTLIDAASLFCVYFSFLHKPEPPGVGEGTTSFVSLTALLRYSSHTIKFTCFKDASQRFFVNPESCATVPALENTPVAPRRCLTCPCSQSSVPHPGPRPPLICLPSLQTGLFWAAHRNGVMC